MQEFELEFLQKFCESILCMQHTSKFTTHHGKKEHLQICWYQDESLNHMYCNVFNKYGIIIILILCDNSLYNHLIILFKCKILQGWVEY